MAIGPESQGLGLSRSQLYRLVRAHTLDDEPADHGSLRNGHLREAVIFLSEYAFSDEKTQPSRRSVRPPTRRRHLLVGVRVLRRQDAIFSSERASLGREIAIFLSERAFSDKKTRPSRRITRPPWRRCHLLTERLDARATPQSGGNVSRRGEGPQSLADRAAEFISGCACDRPRPARERRFRKRDSVPRHDALNGAQYVSRLSVILRSYI